MKKNKETKTNDLFGSDSEVDGGQFSEEERKRASRISQSVTEKLTDNAQGIIKGAYISKREVDRESNMVSVQITVSKKSINAATNVRLMMNGM